MARIAFLGEVLRHRLTGQDRDCPHCASTKTRLVEAKRGLLELRRCEECALLYRWPKQDARRNLAYYQSEYVKGATTAMPSDEEAAHGGGFDATEHSAIETKIGLLRRFESTGRLLDYGCSWGYGLQRLKDAGFAASGFEISGPRAAFGRERLGLEIIDDPAALEALAPGSFDIVFASHVLEHLPRIADTFTLLARLVRSGGLLLAFVPNCDGSKARELGVRWGPMIDRDHVLALTPRFFAANLPRYGFAPSLHSSPYEGAFEALADPADAEARFPGDELAVAARRLKETGA